MTVMPPGADVRGFYAALGVPLAGWAHTEAPVRCFADPDAHAHADRHPSCSVNLHSGAFNCHGCGAHGGAYDAALATGRSPREAIDLMIIHGLTDRRPPRSRPRASAPASTRDRLPAVSARRTEAGARTPRHGPAEAADAHPPTPPPATLRSVGREVVLSVTAGDVRRWAAALQDDVALVDHLERERGWKPDILRDLGVGFDGERVTVPILGERGTLQGLLRLRIHGSQRPKVLALPGTRLGLIPHPSVEHRRVVLVEGPSDMLATRSAGLAALAVPGTHAWRPEWARALGGRAVTVVMDADRPGREAAARIARDLEHQAARVAIVDLDPRRHDGYDLSDWLRDGHNPSAPPQARPCTSQAPERAGVAAASAARAARSAAAAHRPTTANRGALAGATWGAGGSVRWPGV